MNVERRLAAAASVALLPLLAAPTALAIAVRSGGGHRLLIRGWVALHGRAHSGDVMGMMKSHESVSLLGQFPHVQSVVLGEQNADLTRKPLNEGGQNGGKLTAAMLLRVAAAGGRFSSAMLQ
jgi:hypothetical protein